MEASQMKKLFAGILFGFVCAAAYAGAGWSTQKLLDFYGSPTQSTITHGGLGDIDYGVCDVYEWSNDIKDVTAYVLRTDWHGWSAGTVCYELVTYPQGNNDGIPTGISQWLQANGTIWQSIWTPKKSTTRLIFSRKSEEASTQKDIDDLNKFKEQMEGH
jgi:hypothetical protein